MKNIEWSFVMHLSEEDNHCMLFRNTKLCVQKEVVTPYKNGQPGKAEVRFYIDGDKRGFEKESDLIEALKIREENKNK